MRARIMLILIFIVVFGTAGILMLNKQHNNDSSNGTVEYTCPIQWLED